MWKWRARRSRDRKTSAAIHNAGIEHLEERTLLAGNVVASLYGPHLSVVGDGDANAVELTVVNNAVVLNGLDNTTINGGNSVFVVAANTDTMTGNILMLLQGGNDSAVFSRNVKLAGATSVVGGRGDDALSSIGATFQGNVAFFGSEGNDTFSLQDSTTNGSLQVYGEAGDDLVSLTNMTVNNLVKIKTSSGNDGVSFNNVSGDGPVYIKTSLGDDSVTIHDSTLGGPVSVWTRQGQDAVMLETNTFDSLVSINLGRNNDAVDVRDGNTFNGFFGVLGGDSKQEFGTDLPDGDQISVATGTTFEAGHRFWRMEGDIVPQEISGRFDAAESPTDPGGLIARATAADTAAKELAAIELTAAATSARSETSNGVLVTRDANVTISGTTVAGATVSFDTDGDGVFDNDTVTADATGAWSTTVVVTRKDLYTDDANPNDELTGLQTIDVRASTAAGDSADASVTVDYVTGTVVRLTSETDTATTQAFEMELFDTDAPIATANFLNYVSSNRYDNSIIHRSIESFVIQGGGFTVDTGVIANVPADGTIQGEFNAARGNIKSTISMAHTGDQNSGTSQWFINTVDNPSLDDFSGKRHTVFGRVVGNGMTVVDAIAALQPTTDLSAESGSSALTDVPLRAPFTGFERTISGTISTTDSSTQVTGVGTKFTTELKGSTVNGLLRSRLQINGNEFFVASIDDDTHLTLTQAPTTTGTGLTAKTDFAADKDNEFVRFTTVEQILNP